MNLFYNLPDDLQEKIYRYAHELQLKCTFPYIKIKPNPYKSYIYKEFCEAVYNRQDLKHFNGFLDYIHGKAYDFTHVTLSENRYMTMLDLVIELR